VKHAADVEASGQQKWRPLAAAYCKVYSRDSTGRDAFHKDGYTDCLGRFDYASVTGKRGASRVVKMAALVVSAEGCTILQVDPPCGL